MSAIHSLLPSIDRRVGTRALYLNLLTFRYKSPLAMMICVGLALMALGCSDQSASSSATTGKLEQKSPAERRQAAETAYSAGKFERAVELFTQLIVNSPDEASNYLWRAQARQRLGQSDQAENDLNSAVRLSPETPEPLLQRAQLRYARGSLSAAIEDCTRAMQIDGEHRAGAQSLRAGIHLATGAFQQALADCDESIRLNPEFAQAYNNRGLAKQALGDLRGAIEDFSLALEHHGQLSDAYNNRGALRMQLGENELALADLSEAIRLAPLSPMGYDNRSRLYLDQMDQPEKAARDCSRLIQIVEREARQRQGSVAGRKAAAIYARRALAQWKLKKPEDALVDCQAALTIDANCLPAQKLLQEVARKQHQ